MAIDTFSVPIAKAGKDATITVDVKLLNDEMYALVMAEGLKAILNARMTSKAGPGAVTKLSGKELEDAQGRAMKIATENLDKLFKGEIKAKGTKAAKSDLPREVQTEARRIARELVKNVIRDAGLKPSRVAAKDITSAADAMIAGRDGPDIIAKALENLDSRANLKSTIDVSAFVKEDPKLVAKAAKDAAERKTQLSAKQAGLPAKGGAIPTRKRPTAEAHTTH
jgi:hypothetical protein